MPPYVILHHRMPAESDRETHWDLMFQTGDALATWALKQQPCFDHPINAIRLKDHRLDYLEFTGPISGGRGFVERVDAGVFSLCHQSEDHWDLQLDQGSMAGKLTLKRQPDSNQWTALFHAPG